MLEKDNAMSSSSKKRPPSPGDRMSVPDVDCTRHNFFDPSLTDRQRLCWALQTETSVSLAKVEGRVKPSNEAADSTDTLLQSKFLIDVYAKPEDPELTGEFDPKDTMARDRYAFHCKATPALQKSRVADESFASLTKIQVKDTKQDTTLRKRKKTKALCLYPRTCFTLK